MEPKALKQAEEVTVRTAGDANEQGERVQLLDLTEEVTVFLLTVGDEINLRECLDGLRSQTVTFQLEIVNHVAPLWRALQQMIERCKTPLFIEVDEDMILLPHAVESLFNQIAMAPTDVALVCGSLWDCYMEYPIHGIKIYKHNIAKQFAFENNSSSDWMQFRHMKEAGYNWILASLEARSFCLGEHGKHYTPESIFRRWRGLMQKHRRYNNMPWVQPWPKRIVSRFVERKHELDLYALCGIVAGLVGDLPEDREVDFREVCQDFASLRFFLESGC